MIAEHCNIWRMYDDIQDDWDSVTGIVDWVGDNQEELIAAAGPGHFNDPDMLIIGNFALSVDQAKAQFALWAVMAAPLFMGNDLRNLDDEYKAVLQSIEVIAVNQDEAGIQGKRVAHMPPGYTAGDIWVRPLQDGDLAVVLWNRCTYGTPRPMTVQWAQIGLDPTKKMLVRDLYERADLGTFAANYTHPRVNIDGVAMLRLSAAE